MDAVITAGSRPLPNEPLYEVTRGGYKAMLEIAGKPMIQWILDSLSASDQVRNVVVAGLPPYTNLFCEKPLVILEDQGGLLSNARAGVQETLRQHPDSQHVLLISSDVPGITAEMVDWTIRATQDSDVDFLYPVIARETMEKRFPGSRRTYLHLKNIEVTGGDMMGVRAAVSRDDNPLWQKIIASRKNPIRQASLLGFDTLFMIMLRQLSLEEVGPSIGKRLGLRARAVLCPYAELGMDVDKPHQLQLVAGELSKAQAAIV